MKLGIGELFCRKTAHWNVFNEYTKNEFAECSKCGYEVEPDLDYYPFDVYPEKCPNCHRKMMYEEAW